MEGRVRSEVLEEIMSAATSLKIASRDTLTAIRTWEASVDEDNAMFMWNGQCYLGTMLTDTLFLEAEDLASLRDLLPTGVLSMAHSDVPKRHAKNDIIATSPPQPPSNPKQNAWGSTPTIPTHNTPEEPKERIIYDDSIQPGVISSGKRPTEREREEHDPIAEILKDTVHMSAAMSRGKLESLLDQGPVVKKVEISHNDTYLYSALDPPGEANLNSFLTSASCPVDESVVLWKVSKEVSPQSHLIVNGQNVYDPVGLGNGIAFHCSKKLSAVLLHLVNRIVVRDDFLPSIPSPKLVLPLHAANSTTSVCLKSATIDMCAERRLPPAAQMYGEDSFRVSVGDLQEFERSVRFHIASTVPIAFYHELLSIATKEEGVHFFYCLKDVPLCRLTYSSEWDGVLSQLVHSINEGKQKLTQLRMRREGSTQEAQIDDRITQWKAAIRAEQVQVNFLRNRAFDSRLNAMSCTVGKLVSAVRNNPFEYGFQSADHATETLRESMAVLSAKGCISQKGLLLANGMNGKQNQVVSASDVPILFVSASHGTSATWDASHTSVLCACIEGGVDHLSLSVPSAAWLRSLIRVSAQPRFARLTFWVNPGPHIEGCVQLITSLDTKAPRVILHRRSPKFLADHLSREGYTPGLLVHSSTEALSVGSIGGHWESGTEATYGEEEDVAATSTLLLAHTAISTAHMDIRRYIAAEVLETTETSYVAESHNTTTTASTTEFNNSGGSAISEVVLPEAPPTAPLTRKEEREMRKAKKTRRSDTDAGRAASKARAALQQLMEEQRDYVEDRVAGCCAEETRGREHICKQEGNKHSMLRSEAERLHLPKDTSAQQARELLASLNRLIDEMSTLESQTRIRIGDKEKAERGKIAKLLRQSARSLRQSVVVEEMTAPVDLSPRDPMKANDATLLLEKMKNDTKAVMAQIEQEERRRMLLVCTEQEHRYVIVKDQVREITSRSDNTGPTQTHLDQLYFIASQELDEREGLMQVETLSRPAKETEVLERSAVAAAQYQNALCKAADSLQDGESLRRKSVMRPQQKEWDALMLKHDAEMGLLRFQETSRGSAAETVSKETEQRRIDFAGSETHLRSALQSEEQFDADLLIEYAITLRELFFAHDCHINQETLSRAAEEASEEEERLLIRHTHETTLELAGLLSEVTEKGRAYPAAPLSPASVESIVKEEDEVEEEVDTNSGIEERAFVSGLATLQSTESLERVDVEQEEQAVRGLLPESLEKEDSVRGLPSEETVKEMVDTMIHNASERHAADHEEEEEGTDSGLEERVFISSVVMLQSQECLMRVEVEQREQLKPLFSLRLLQTELLKEGGAPNLTRIITAAREENSSNESVEESNITTTTNANTSTAPEEQSAEEASTNTNTPSGSTLGLSVSPRCAAGEGDEDVNPTEEMRRLPHGEEAARWALDDEQTAERFTLEDAIEMGFFAAQAAEQLSLQRGIVVSSEEMSRGELIREEESDTFQLRLEEMRGVKVSCDRVREREREEGGEAAANVIDVDEITDIKDLVQLGIQNALVMSNNVVNNRVDNVRQQRQSREVSLLAVKIMQRAWRQHKSREVRKQKQLELDQAESLLEEHEIRMHEFYEESMEKISQLILAVVSRKVWRKRLFLLYFTLLNREPTPCATNAPSTKKLPTCLSTTSSPTPRRTQPSPTPTPPAPLRPCVQTRTQQQRQYHNYCLDRQLSTKRLK